MKIWYFENTHRDKSNDILYDIIYLCILIEKYCQSKFGQNYTFLNGLSITGQRKRYLRLCINNILIFKEFELFVKKKVYY